MGERGAFPFHVLYDAQSCEPFSGPSPCCSSWRAAKLLPNRLLRSNLRRAVLRLARKRAFIRTGAGSRGDARSVALAVWLATTRTAISLRTVFALAFVGRWERLARQRRTRIAARPVHVVRRGGAVFGMEHAWRLPRRIAPGPRTASVSGSAPWCRGDARLLRTRTARDRPSVSKRAGARLLPAHALLRRAPTVLPARTVWSTDDASLRMGSALPTVVRPASPPSDAPTWVSARSGTGCVWLLRTMIAGPRRYAGTMAGAAPRMDVARWGTMRIAARPRCAVVLAGVWHEGTPVLVGMGAARSSRCASDTGGARWWVGHAGRRGTSTVRSPRRVGSRVDVGCRKVCVSGKGSGWQLG